MWLAHLPPRPLRIFSTSSLFESSELLWCIARSVTFTPLKTAEDLRMQRLDALHFFSVSWGARTHNMRTVNSEKKTLKKHYWPWRMCTRMMVRHADSPDRNTPSIANVLKKFFLGCRLGSRTAGRYRVGHNIHIYQSFRSGRIWHKVNCLSRV